jgi:3-oxoacyl-[acyl-carrier-protein] synthase II
MRRRVAVSGFGVVSPIGAGRNQFFEALVEGRSGISRITHFDCSTFAVQVAGEVREKLILPPNVERIAARDSKVGFGFAAVTQALQSAQVEGLNSESLLHLGVSLESFDLDRAMSSGTLDLTELATRGASNVEAPLQTPLDACTELVAGAFGQPGRKLTNCSACAASAQAIGHAFHELRSGRADLALCGGLDSMINPLGVGGFQLLGALTVENDRGASACRPFDRSRSGTVLGEGAAILVLEPLDRVRADGRPVHAELCGYGSSLDAHSLSAPDPDGDGAARAMRAALDDAEIRPEAVAHINSHGTGTALNDEIEAAAIRRVFDSWQTIPIAATKSITGHLIAAAGAVEAVACLLPLVEGDLPPNPWLSHVGEGCELNHVTESGQRFDGEFVLSSSFGFGGQNASLVFRRYDA